MYIKWMHIENYRNLADVTLSFHNDINYFVGENAVGKSNFLDLLEIIMECHGFIESDFTDVNKPIRIDFEISLGELNYKSMYTADKAPPTVYDLNKLYKRYIHDYTESLMQGLNLWRYL